MGYLFLLGPLSEQAQQAHVCSHPRSVLNLYLIFFLKRDFVSENGEQLYYVLNLRLRMTTIAEPEWWIYHICYLYSCSMNQS